MREKCTGDELVDCDSALAYPDSAPFDEDDEGLLMGPIVNASKVTEVVKGLW